jgi:hypothetical protein
MARGDNDFKPVDFPRFSALHMGETTPSGRE